MTMMAQAPTARPALSRWAAEPEPAELRHRRVRLSTGSAAAAHAAGHVRAASPSGGYRSTRAWRASSPAI